MPSDREFTVTENLSRNVQLYKYLAQQCKGMPRKHLVKMAYMADLVARQFLGHPISDLKYVVYYFGPYPPETPAVIAELEARGLAWAQPGLKVDQDDYAFKKLFDSGKPAVFDFTLGENAVLAYVVNNYLEMDTEELTEDVVKYTTPWKAALASDRLKERIPMEMVDGEGVREIGFDLERVMNAEKQAEEGDFLTAREYFDGLRNRIAARYAE
jgi:antitoxin SocA-like protein